MTTAGNFTGLILLTGLPGSGKSLRMVGYMKEALALGRPVYVCNMPTIRIPGVQILENPHEWRTLPPESVLFVDEAQRFFRARRGNVEPPESITAMETIRHDGVCIVMTTQQPTYLDKHIRGLIGKHEHFVRNFGHESANVYEFRECYDDVQSPTLRDNGQFSVWLYPKKNYADYDSAEVHTVKARIPRKLLIGAALFLLAVAALGYGFFGLLGIGDMPEAGPVEAPASTGQPPLSADAKKPAYRTADDLAKALAPRIAAMPWSAPMFDGRDVVAEPVLYCMSSDTGCTCLTEQGTRYRMQTTQCRHLARHGPAYDPFKKPTEPGTYTAPEVQALPVVERTLRGSAGEPSQVGSSAQGNVWALKPETLRAAGE